MQKTIIEPKREKSVFFTDKTSLTLYESDTSGKFIIYNHSFWGHVSLSNIISDD